MCFDGSIISPPLLELMLNNGLKNIMSFVSPFGSIKGRVPKIRIFSFGSGEQDSTSKYGIRTNI